MTCGKDSQGETMHSPSKTTNRLIQSNSPYLLQHAHNPVDWYPWGEEAFKKAREEDKPIFLSIGYSTCHWCHVMAHECFEDEAVAALLNANFVCIKVDREERPDIDQLYMAAATTLIGRGGWPLTIVMGPDKRPFFAGTYFPKHSSPGRVGLMELLPRIQAAWVNQRQEIEDSATQILEALQAQTPAQSGAVLGQEILQKAAVDFKTQYDPGNGGFGRAPKFPSPHNLVFLLREGYRTQDAALTEMALNSLRAMRYGGLFDQIGFGFHRYSTDATWHLPHFEKMLYDQATLMLAYTEAWQIEKDPLFRDTVQEIYLYLKDKLYALEGAFYAAEDADSDGEEGKFYVWSHAELASHLDEEALALIEEHFRVDQAGNFQDEATGQPSGENIFHLDGAQSFSSTQSDPQWAHTRQLLYKIREERIKPGLDNKILADWNGLILTALSRAARVFQSGEYRETAEDLAEHLLNEFMTPEGKLVHLKSGEETQVSGFSDDYSFVIQGLRSLYEASPKVAYLQKAIELQAIQLNNFWDPDQGAFFFTGVDQENLFIRQKEIYDGAIPSGNSIAAENLYYLGRLTENKDWELKSQQIEKAFASQVNRAPRGFAALLQTVQARIAGSREVVIAGQLKDYYAALSLLNESYAPFSMIIHNPQGKQSELWELAPFLAYQRPQGEQVTVYVCENYTCQSPLIGMAAIGSGLSALMEGRER
jgi:uncharacterized protein YyaL (SSP411 family)